MAVRHSTLTGADLHEPKGITSALSGQVYKASGGGTGAWGYFTETINLGPVSTDSTGNFTLIPIAQASRIITAVFTIGGVLTSTGSADVVVHVKNASGVIIAQATFPVASTTKGSSVTVNLSESVAKGSYVELGVSAESTSQTDVYVAIAMEVVND